MKYFFDTEFIEGFHKPLFWKRRHFIDLISIGIVSEDGREYYAISNEFNPDDADEWVRTNVIDKIEAELFQRLSTFAKSHFSFDLKDLLKQFGKSNKQIAEDIINFCKPNEKKCKDAGIDAIIGNIDPNIEFYAYYADYDWVLFCSLFGRMIDLPTGFPMYCRDIKQIIDEKANEYFEHSKGLKTVASALEFIRKHKDCPQQENEHSAIDDARWNKSLYQFIQTL